MPLLKPFGPEIWLADGGEAEVIGFRYPTRMAVIRLTGGGLFIWSPITLTEGLKRELSALGEVAHIVAPNSLHHLFIAEWVVGYPTASLHAAPGLAGKRPDLDFDGELGARPPPEWSADIDQTPVLGNRITTEVVFFHQASGSALFCDLIQQFPKGWFKGWRALIARLDLMTEAEPTVPRKFRVAFSDRQAGRQSISRIFDWPVQKVVMAHGTPVETDGALFISRAFRWLTGRP